MVGGMRMVTSVAALLIGAGIAYADGSPEKGEELAAQWCSQCHDIAPGGAFKEFPPSFTAIAIYRAPDEIRGRIAFPALHSGMRGAGVYLIPGNLDDLVAYIVSLEETQSE